MQFKKSIVESEHGFKQHRLKDQLQGIYMQKLVWFISIFMFILLTGCGQATEVPTQTPLPSSTPSQTRTVMATFTPTVPPTPTRTRKPTNTPTPTITPTPTQTPTPPLIWSDALTPVAILENFYGAWSPVENKLAGVAYTIDFQTGAIALASAPNFDLQPVEIGGGNMAGGYASWRPDGQWILFPGPREAWMDAGVGEVAELWAMDSNGNNPYSLIPDRSFWNFRFSGWMDIQTLLIGEYSGGGNWIYYLFDFPSGEEINQTWIHAGGTFKGTNKYIPGVTTLVENSALFVITRNQQPQSQSIHENEYVRYFPSSQVNLTSDSHYFFFKDWLPGTYKMLVSWFAPDESGTELLSAHLLLWNVENDTVISVAPGGVDGKYSPDGKYLAYVTLGQSSKEESSALPTLSSLPVGATPHLQLLDTGTGQVIFTLPVISTKNTLDYNFPVYETNMAFSPDNHYMAFLTPARVEVDKKGLPTGEEMADENQVYLNIFDLQSKQLVQSIPSKEHGHWYGEEWLQWSPTGTKILFIAPSDNWQIFDIRQEHTIPITISGGNLAQSPVWSFDGQYLTFHVRQDPYEPASTWTYLFQFP